MLDPEYLSETLKTILQEKGKEKHGSNTKSVIAAGYTDGSIELFRSVLTFCENCYQFLLIIFFITTTD